MADDEFASLKISIEASLKDFSAKMGEFENILKGTEEQGKKTGESFGTMFASMFTAQAALGILKSSLSAIKDFAIECYKAFDGEAVALAKLRNQVGGATDDLDEYATKIAQTTRFTREDTLSAMARITAYVKDKEQIKALLPAMADFATQQGTSLPAAAQIFSRALMGTGGNLGRLRLGIEGAAGSQERLNSIVQKSTEYFGGQAEAVAKVGAGPLIQLNKGVDELKEKLGHAVADGINPFLTQVNEHILPALDKWIEKMLILSDAARLQQLQGQIDTTSAKIQELMTRAPGKSGGLVAALMSAGTMGLYGGATGQTYSAATEDIGALRKNLADLQKTYDDVQKAMQSKGKAAPEAPEGRGAKEQSAESKKRQEIIDKIKDGSFVPEEEVYKAFAGYAALSTLVRYNYENFTYDKAKKGAKEEDKAKVVEEQAAREQIIPETESTSASARLKRTQDKEIAGMDKTLKSLMSYREKDGVDQIALEESIAKQKDAIALKSQKFAIELKRAEVEEKLQLGQQEADSLTAIFDGLYKLSGSKSVELFELAKQASAAKTIMSTAEAVMKAWAEGGPIMGPILAITAALAGAVQLAVIESQKPPSMASGGPVIGDSHAIGGVYANLEGGEFIQSRYAVDRYGVRAMDAINRGMIPADALAPYTGARPVASSPATGGMSATATIVNFLDMSAFKQFLNTEDGKRALVNHVSDNSFALRKALAIA